MIIDTSWVFPTKQGSGGEHFECIAKKHEFTLQVIEKLRNS